MRPRLPLLRRARPACHASSRCGLPLAAPCAGRLAAPSPAPVGRARAARLAHLSAPQRAALAPLRARLAAHRRAAQAEVARDRRRASRACRRPSRQRISGAHDRVGEADARSERGQARLHFQEATPARRRRSARRAGRPTRHCRRSRRSKLAGTRRTGRRAARRPSQPQRARRQPRDAAQAKSNIVPNPAYAAPPQARRHRPWCRRSPGATTIADVQAPERRRRTSSRACRRSPPRPGFVDKPTLLPQRGPQGAATRAAAAPRPTAAAQ